MTPSHRDIDAALDLLDWIPLPAILAIRYEVDRAIHEAQQLRESGAPKTQSSVVWTPIEAALLYVLWSTSDETLHAQVRASVH